MTGRYVLRASLTALALAACGPASTPVDASIAADAGHDAASVDANVDAARAPCPDTFAGCATIEDHTGVATFAVSFGTGNSYAPNCIRVSAGTVVTLPASAFHPLARASCSPAAAPALDSTGGDYTFDTAGSYGYYCANHGSDTGAGMAGLIIVE